MSKFAALDIGRVVAAHGRHVIVESPDGELADRAFGPRTKSNQRGMAKTLANLKVAAEAAATDGPVRS